MSEKQRSKCLPCPSSPGSSQVVSLPKIPSSRLTTVSRKLSLTSSDYLSLLPLITRGHPAGLVSLLPKIPNKRSRLFFSKRSPLGESSFTVTPLIAVTRPDRAEEIRISRRRESRFRNSALETAGRRLRRINHFEGGRVFLFPSSLVPAPRLSRRERYARARARLLSHEKDPTGRSGGEGCGRWRKGGGRGEEEGGGGDGIGRRERQIWRVVKIEQADSAP